MHLSLSLLGPFQVMLDGTPVTKFGYDKVRALLAYLAVESNRPIPRQEIAALLWQDQSPEAALHSTSQALLKLRRALQDPSGDPVFIRAQRGAIEFVLSPEDGLDTRAISGWLDACERHAHAELLDCAECIERLERAVERYGGDFLQGLLIGDSAAFEDWVIIRRESFRRRILTALDRLTRHYAERGIYDTAETYARRQLELDPYAEEAHRALMNILARNGKRTAALAQYENCRRLLAQEIGVEPEPETRALYERLLAAGETRPHNLPLPLALLIGRDKELAHIAERLAAPDCRLVNLVGPGGIGKTTLALHAAQANLPAFLNGAFFVSLAAFVGAAETAESIASALSLSLDGESDVKAQLFEHLRARAILLVLDNVEPQGEARDFVVELLNAAPHVKLLITSREPLNLRAEWLVRVQGLSFPGDEVISQSGRDFQAVRLFVERARRVSAAFAPSPEDEIQIARICRLLWGSPLGIELAAGWVGAWSCRAIADEMERNLDFLTTDAYDVPERHTSLRTVFEQTWAHLSEGERKLLRRLAVFRFPFRRHAAQVVTGATAYQLGALVSKSLLALSAEERYDIHPLLKQFLEEKLGDAGERGEVRDRHAEYFSRWMQGHSSRRAQLSAQAAALEMREVIAELSAALEWSAERRNIQVIETLGTGVYNYLAAVGQYSEGIRLFGRVARVLRAHAPLTPEEEGVLAKEFGFLGALEMLFGAYDSADASLGKSLNLARTAGDRKLIAFCLHSIARLAFSMADVNRARELVTQGLELRLESGEFLDAQYSKFMLANMALEAGSLNEAYALYSDGLAGVRAAGYTDGLGIAIPLNGLGVVAYRRGNPALARQWLEESLQLSRAIDHRWSSAEILKDLARLDADQGEYARADGLVQESLDFYQAIGKRGDAAYALGVRGWLAECQGQLEEAQSWYAESHSLLERTRHGISAPVALVDLGRTIARLQDPRHGQELLLRALTFFTTIGYAGGLVIAHAGLGIAARALGDFDDAQAHFETAVAMADESEEVYEGLQAKYELASLLSAGGQHESASVLLAQVADHPATPRHIRLQARVARDK